MITSTPQPLCPGERFPVVGPRAGLDVLKKREIPLFFPPPGIYPRFLRRPTRNLVTMLTELPQLLHKEQEVMHLPVENVYTNRLLSAVFLTSMIRLKDIVTPHYKRQLRETSCHYKDICNALRVKGALYRGGLGS